MLTLVAIEKKTPGPSFSAGAEDTSAMLSAAAECAAVKRRGKKTPNIHQNTSKYQLGVVVFFNSHIGMVIDQSIGFRSSQTR